MDKRVFEEVQVSRGGDPELFRKKKSLDILERVRTVFFYPHRPFTKVVQHRAKRELPQPAILLVQKRESV